MYLEISKETLDCLTKPSPYINEDPLKFHYNPPSLCSAWAKHPDHKWSREAPTSLIFGPKRGVLGYLQHHAVGGGELPTEGSDQLPPRPQDAEHVNLQQLGSSLEGRQGSACVQLCRKAATALKV